MKRKRTVVFSLVAVVLTLLAGGVEGGDSMSAELQLSAGEADDLLPDVAYDSTHDEYLAVWHFYYPGWPRTVEGTLYTADGTSVDHLIIAYEFDPFRDNIQPSVAYDPVNDRYLVVWVRDFFGDGSDLDIYGRLVPADGVSESLPAFIIEDAVGHQWSPRVAYGGGNQEFLVTWWNQSPAGAAHNVAAQRISAGSGLLAGNVINVTSDTTEDRVSPDIAYNRARNEYLVVYHKVEAGGGDIYGVRLSATGAILGAGDFGIAGWPDAESGPRIAASRVSNTWAVTWHSQVDANQKDVFARTVSVDGTGTIQMGDVVTISENLLDDSFPDIGAHPESSNFLVTWQTQYSSLAGEYGIDARVVNSGGTRGVHFRPRQLYFDETTDCSASAVAGGIDDWMVVWQQSSDGTPTNEDVRGRILFADILVDGFESNNTTEWSVTVP